MVGNQQIGYSASREALAAQKRENLWLSGVIAAMQPVDPMTIVGRFPPFPGETQGAYEARLKECFADEARSPLHRALRRFWKPIAADIREIGSIGARALGL